MEKWRLLISGPANGALNMAVDEAIAEAVGRGESPPTIRFYQWNPPALSLGYFQDRDREVDLDRLARLGFDCVKRPTGGRAVLHDDELTYSFIVPEAHPLFPAGVVASYQVIAAGLVRGLLRLGVPAEMAPAPFSAPGALAASRGGRGGPHAAPASAACFDAPSWYEITAGGKKIAGSAQVRRHQAILQHGSVPLSFDATRQVAALRLRDEAVRARLAQSLAGRAASLNDFRTDKAGFLDVAHALASGWEEALGIRLFPEKGLSAAEEKKAFDLYRDKYTQEWWNAHRAEPGDGMPAERSRGERPRGATKPGGC